jgi:hypothetical protein
VPLRPRTVDHAERPLRGVKLAKISKTGDQVFRSLTTTSGLAIVLLVLFVGIFLSAVALPSLQADQDNFLTSRNWTVAGNELRFGIAGLLWTTVLYSILALAIAVPIAVGVALCLTRYLHKRASGPTVYRAGHRRRTSGAADGQPCSELDPISTLAIEDLIGELKEQYTVVILTHNMQQAARVSDQTAFFNLAAQGKPGRLIEMGSTEKIFSNPDQKATEDYITGRLASLR